jgi:hypothetical protein
VQYRRLATLITVVALVGAGCGGASTASPTPPVAAAATPGPTAIPAATAAMTPAPTATPAPTPTAASASQASVTRCAETSNVEPTATVHWNIPVTGGDPTIKAGQAVEFVTTGLSPTVTEGTDGMPAADACIDKTIGSNAAAMSIVVAFYQPGDYSITCRKVPGGMHTVVHVQ